jgi:hypothetical protein
MLKVTHNRPTDPVNATLVCRLSSHFARATLHQAASVACCHNQLMCCNAQKLLTNVRKPSDDHVTFIVHRRERSIHPWHVHKQL